MFLLPQSIPLHEAGAHLLPGASQPASVPGIEYSTHIPSQETRADWPHLTSPHGFGLIVLTLPLKESCVSLKRPELVDLNWSWGVPSLILIPGTCRNQVVLLTI